MRNLFASAAVLALVASAPALAGNPDHGNGATGIGQGGNNGTPPGHDRQSDSQAPEGPASAKDVAPGQTKDDAPPQ
jgi:hypothetical protein